MFTNPIYMTINTVARISPIWGEKRTPPERNSLITSHACGFKEEILLCLKTSLLVPRQGYDKGYITQPSKIKTKKVGINWSYLELQDQTWMDELLVLRLTYTASMSETWSICSSRPYVSLRLPNCYCRFAFIFVPPA
uniref:Uncharacterized protein n=1 Tax=Opuntia streptacantha TaxID=393608 RepID=A0A7C9CAL3_OPUST